jgi:GTPase SAR1 family protein
MDDPSRITITICGDGGCGKSSITLRLVRSQWTSDYDPTIEDSYSITRRIDGQTYHLSLTDTAGQEEYRGMWGGQNLRADAFLMVYDITNADSLDQLEYFNELIEIEAETRADAAAAAAKHGGGAGGARGAAASQTVQPVKIVAGNKCDLQESRQVDAKTGLEWARRRNCGFMETSARNVVNIEETFALIVRRVVEKRRAAAREATGGGGSGADRRGARGGLVVDAAAAAAGERGGNRRDRGAGDAGAQVSGVGTRRAVTAPLSPLPVGGPGTGADEKAMRLGRGPIGRPKGSNGGFWGSLRCW